MTKVIRAVVNVLRDSALVDVLKGTLTALLAIALMLLVMAITND